MYQQGRVLALITNESDISLDEMMTHQNTVQHSISETISKIMVCDTHNDDLFISDPNDQLVNEKYLYLGYLGVNNSYSTISVNLVYKYEFLIKPELKHVVKPEKSIDDGLSTKLTSTLKEVDA